MRVLLDGRPLDPASAVIGADRGLLYGEGVFEVLRTYRGRPAALAAHLTRLAEGAAALGLPFDRPALERELEAAIAPLDDSEAYIRFGVSGGLGFGPLRAAHVESRRWIWIGALSPSAGALARVITRPSGRDLGAPLATLKSSSYLGAIEARRAAERAGVDEAILMGPGGELLEGAASNLFLVSSGELLTPPVSLGLLDGVTRRVVLALASLAGVPRRETVLFAADLYRADEAFLTSSLRELSPLVEADGEVIGAGRPGPLTERLQREYRASAEVGDLNRLVGLEPSAHPR